MKKTFLQTIAMFMIALIVTMPIYGSVVMAGSLTDIQYSGKNGVQGFISKSSDYLDVNVTATKSLSDDIAAITTANVFFNLNQEEQFNECIATDNSSTSAICNYRTYQTDWAPGEYAFSINFYDDVNRKIATATKHFFVDGLAPTIVDMQLPYYVNKSFSVAYNINDRACDNCGEVCSGLNRIELKVNGTVKANMSFEGQNCNEQGNFAADISQLGISQGANNLCLKVYDNVGLTTSQCKDVFVDYTAPQFIDSSFELTSQAGSVINYIGTSEFSAYASINITDEESGLNVSSVFGNFSSLNSRSPQSYANVKADSCNQLEDTIWNCRFPVRILNVSGDMPLSMNASDLAGNTAKYTKTVNIKQDQTAPVVSAIYTNHHNSYFGRTNNTIIAEIIETESGLNDKNIYLDLSDIGRGSKVQASNCTEFLDEGLWRCYWNGLAAPNINSGDMFTVGVDSLYDDAGNAFDPTASLTTATFVNDVVAPKFINATIKPLDVERDVLLPNDVVSIQAYIDEEDSGIVPEESFVDLRELVRGSQPIAAESCDPTAADNTTYLCKWEYSGTFKTNIDFTAYITVVDSAGNKKMCREDNSCPKAHVSEPIQGNFDFWNDYAQQIGKNYGMNSNMLWMGGNVPYKVSVQLVPNASVSVPPYVQAFRVLNCHGGLGYGLGTKLITDSDISILDQFYYNDETAGQERTSKYLVLILPQQTKKDVQKALSGTAIEKKISILGMHNQTQGTTVFTTNEPSFIIQCNAQVTNSRSAKGGVYVPDEPVNISIAIPLVGGVFVEPSIRAIDDIYAHKKEIDTINQIDKFIDSVVKFLQPICQIVSTIRQMINSVCSIITALSFVSAPTGVPANVQCKLKSNFLEKIWYGNTQKKEVAATDVSKPASSGGLGGIFSSLTGGLTGGLGSFGGGGTAPGSTKAFFSMGYVCDLVLCEDCSHLWANDFFGGFNQTFKDMSPVMAFGKVDPKDTTTPAEQANRADFSKSQYLEVNAGNYFLSPAFDPQKSLIVAVICSPPCLTGIRAKLEQYKQILVGYNVCMNTAAIKGDSTAQCKHYLSTQTCVYIVGEFWYIVIGLVKQFIVKSITYGIERLLAKQLNCNPNAPFLEPGCTASRVIGAVAVLTEIMSFSEMFKTLMDSIHSLGGGSGSSEASAKKAVDDNYKDKECDSRYGCMPQL